MSTIRKHWRVMVLVLLTATAFFGAGYLLRGESPRAPIVIETNK